MRKQKAIQIAQALLPQAQSGLVRQFEKTPDVRYHNIDVAAASASSTSVRRNAASTIERTDKFKNIDDGMVPFRHSSSSYGNSTNGMDIRDAVILCQKCYYNFSLFRNIIDLMTEFSVSDLYYRGGSKQSRDFFKALWNKVNMWDLQDKFFREWYRSGNVFLYRFDADIQPSDVKKITQIFGEDGIQTEVPIEKMKIPARYVVLNPADIQMLSTLDFSSGIYFKVLTDYEVSRLRTPQTDADADVFKNLSPETQKAIKAGAKLITIPLDPNKVASIFYKRQDYEPFGVPMGYPVLEDINAKAEMRKIDMAIARTMQQIVLLVTTGAEPDKGGINQKNIDALNKIFQNQSVGRVLIADYTTEAEFIIPAIGDLLDPKKYEVINDDINIGLNNVFAGGEKFANQQQKVEIFIARLEQGRQAFLNNFLIPEMKRIAQSLNFKNFPTPYFKDIELKDNTNYAKMWARLIELGVLTPEQGIEAIKSNTLPETSTMQEDQQSYKDQRDKGLYMPLVGGPTNDTGRPTGTGTPKTVQTIGPIGTGSSKISLKKVHGLMLIAQDLEKSVVENLKKIHNIKRMSKVQKEVASGIVNQILANEEPDKWLSSVEEYCQNPQDKNPERVKEVIILAAEHQVDDYSAGILFAGKVENV